MYNIIPMSPEHTGGTNIIRLFKGEQFTGQGGTIKGPASLQVKMLSEWLDVQGQGKHVYIPGNGYEDVLQKIIADSRT